MLSRDDSRRGPGGTAIVVGLGACTLCLLAENAILMLVLSHRLDWSQSWVLVRVALKVVALLAGTVWPWASSGLALLLVGGVVFTALIRKPVREVRHA